MHQYFMWTALESYGMGANLQHYNPLINTEVEKLWALPAHWTLEGTTRVWRASGRDRSA